MTKTFSLIAAASLLALVAGCAKDSQKTDKTDVAAKADSTKADSSKADKATATPDTKTNTAKSDEMARAKRLAEHEVGEVEVQRLSSMIDDGTCAVFDANSDSTRKKFGLIPTATALSHYSKYEASELPASKDTKLVFYCSNESCGASHTAAEKAVLAGYDDVSVFPAGIMGWKDAGKETKTYQN